MDPAAEASWRLEWGDRVYFSHLTVRTAGVATLFSPDLRPEVLGVAEAVPGRLLHLRVRLEGLVVNLVNVYAPTSGPERLHFFQQASAFLGTLDPHECLAHSSSIRLAPFSDHHLATVTVSLCAERPGPAYWHFNNSLLEDVGFMASFREFWLAWRGQRRAFPSARRWWDLGKVCSRLFCGDYTQGASRRRDAAIGQLEREVLELERRLAASPKDPSLCGACREKREVLLFDPASASFGRWIAAPASSTPWRKRGGAKKHITCILAEDGTPLTDPAEITDYKVVTKAILLRLGSVLADVIHPDQTYTIPRRTIFDNLYLVRDLLELECRDGLSFTLLSLDQEKAFDRVDHRYLLGTLRAFGLGPQFVGFLQVLYASAECLVRLNWTLTKPVSFGRGVQQGCPLSGQLYALAIAPFLCLLCRRLTGLVLWVPELRLVLLAYVNDVLLMVQDPGDLARVEACQAVYSAASSAQVNWFKSSGLVDLEFYEIMIKTRSKMDDLLVVSSTF
ncbi:unnamed protein product [Caretta caretta]